MFCGRGIGAGGGREGGALSPSDKVPAGEPFFLQQRYFKRVY